MISFEGEPLAEDGKQELLQELALLPPIIQECVVTVGHDGYVDRVDLTHEAGSFSLMAIAMPGFWGLHEDCPMDGYFLQAFSGVIECYNCDYRRPGHEVLEAKVHFEDRSDLAKALALVEAQLEEYFSHLEGPLAASLTSAVVRGILEAAGNASFRNYDRERRAKIAAAAAGV